MMLPILPGNLVYLLIGMGFGVALELSGFGDSRRLIAQFYFKELRVLKVMFTAIVTACVLLFLTSALGWVSIDRIFINPTFLASGITGGLIMGAGFIIGGFCPGTSVVSAATLKIDGIFFLLGALLGVGLFGETVASFKDFYYATDWGRTLLPDVLGVSTGVVVLGVVLMALGMFYGSELLEHVVGQKKPLRDFKWIPKIGPRTAGAVLLLCLALATLILGQPDLQAKWRKMKPVEEKKIDSGEILVSSQEVMEVLKDPMIAPKLYDLRDEVEYNQFHLERSLLVSRWDDEMLLRDAVKSPSNGVILLVSSSGLRAIEAWKRLRASGIANIYVLEGGMNQWLQTFPCPSAQPVSPTGASVQAADSMRFRFLNSLGARHCISGPDSPEAAGLQKVAFTKKIKIQTKAALKGGCG